MNKGNEWNGYLTKYQRRQFQGIFGSPHYWQLTAWIFVHLLFYLLTELSICWRSLCVFRKPMWGGEGVLVGILLVDMQIDEDIPNLSRSRLYAYLCSNMNFHIGPGIMWIRTLYIYVFLNQYIYGHKYI